MSDLVFVKTYLRWRCATWSPERFGAYGPSDLYPQVVELADTLREAVDAHTGGGPAEPFELETVAAFWSLSSTLRDRWMAAQRSDRKSLIACGLTREYVTTAVRALDAFGAHISRGSRLSDAETGFLRAVIAWHELELPDRAAEDSEAFWADLEAADGAVQAGVDDFLAGRPAALLDPDIRAELHRLRGRCPMGGDRRTEVARTRQVTAYVDAACQVVSAYEKLIGSLRG